MVFRADGCLPAGGHQAFSAVEPLSQEGKPAEQTFTVCSSLFLSEIKTCSIFIVRWEQRMLDHVHCSFATIQQGRAWLSETILKPGCFLFHSATIKQLLATKTSRKVDIIAIWTRADAADWGAASHNYAAGCSFHVPGLSAFCATLSMLSRTLYATESGSTLHLYMSKAYEAERTPKSL